MIQFEKIINDWKKEKTARTTTESEWQEVADYCFPRRDFTTTRTDGQNRRTKIYDSTGIKCVLLLASALHANLTPIQTKWFYFKSEVDKEYWEEVQNKLLGIFASPESRFALNMHEFFLDCVAFGTGVMGAFNVNGRMVFKSFNLADCWIRENQYGVVDTLKYCQKMTADRMVDEFGMENVHEKVRDAYKDGDASTKFEVLYCVGPRVKNSGVGAVSEEKPFYSINIDVTNKHQLGKEGGYDEFPFIVGRFSKRSGETYGYGCGQQSISEVKMLNQIVETMWRAAAKNADPPLLSPIDGLVLPMRLDPSGINYYDPEAGKPEFWNNNFRPDYMDFLIKEKRSDIEKIFFIDWLTLPERDRMTATETMQRAQDSFKNMSAINARMESEVLSTIIKRVYMLAIDIGEIDPPPNSSAGQEIKIEYTSPVAMAQKSISSNSVLQATSLLAQFAQLDPSVVNVINAPQVVRDQLENTFFLPPSYVRSEDEFNDMMEQQQEAQGSMAEAELMKNYGAASKDVADAVTTLGGVE